MPKASTSKSKRFQMDTGSFAHIWKNHIGKSKSNDWKTFVLACFERFTGGSEYSNKQMLQAEDKGWGKWDDDKKYSFLSERCYSKAIGINRRLALAEKQVQPLPNGYKDRAGKKASTRITIDDIAAIFG